MQIKLIMIMMVMMMMIMIIIMTVHVVIVSKEPKSKCSILTRPFIPKTALLNPLRPSE